ncbi:hypothetical protein HPB50_012114 [Hyalomma asiaticum]|uniref:Uncharacterized protein n=1 Tax=Hyalomma asiaticum TaxID=266040 RepID=A0ACB7TIQ4_HYAAI|nr:hypothetical protein HPB50_012114 [Hyalomma asiaticum]
MAALAEESPAGFTLNSTSAYDLLLSEAGRILKFTPDRIPLSPQHRARVPNGVAPSSRSEERDRRVRRPRSPPYLCQHRQQLGAHLPAQAAIAASRGSRGAHLVSHFVGTSPLFSTDNCRGAGRGCAPARGGEQQHERRGEIFHRPLMLLIAHHPSLNCTLFASGISTQQQQSADRGPS